MALLVVAAWVILGLSLTLTGGLRLTRQGLRMTTESEPVAAPQLKPRPAPMPGAVELGPGSTLVTAVRAWSSVQVRWVVRLDAPEAFVVVGDRIYVSDACIRSISVATGKSHFTACKPDGNGIFSDGGDTFAPAGPGRIRIIAEYNDDVLVDTVHGRILRRKLAGGRFPRDFHPFPVRKDRHFRYDFDLPDGMTAVRDGAVAWQIREPEAYFDFQSPQPIPGGLVLITGTGLLVALDVEEA